MLRNKNACARAQATRYGALALLPLALSAATGNAVAQSRNNSYQSPRQTYGYSGWDAPTASIWQGAYGGAHFGYGFGSFETGAPLATSSNNDGGIGGLYLGHTWQQGQMVLGVEGDLGASWAGGNSKGSNGINLSASTAWIASLRGRIGYSFGSAMVYATGGAALARAELTLSDWNWTGRADDVLLGWTIGAGLEYKLAPNISTRIEALHYRFGDKEINAGNGVIPYSADQTVVRAGLTFHLR